MAEKEWASWCGNKIDATLNADACKSNPVISTIIAKSTQDKKISWQQDLPDFGTESISITETKSGEYLAGAGDAIIQLTTSGVVSNITQLGNISEHDTQPVKGNNSDTYPVLFGSVVLRFDTNGRIISKESLPAGQIRTPTRDGGLLTVDLDLQLPNGKRGAPLLRDKIRPGWIKEFTDTVQTPFELPHPTRVIQTSDGGYVVLTWADNQTGKRV